MKPVLEIDRLSVRYGAVQAIKEVSIKVDAGTIVSLVGANGAGKTTLMKSILGLTKPQAGDIRFKSESILGLPCHEIVEKGISQSPEGRQIFSDMTVYDNLVVGAYSRQMSKRGLEDRVDEILEIFPILRERRQQLGGTLSGGEQQMLAIGRALMPGPNLLLLDEPSLGVSPLMAEKIFEVLVALNQKGTAILLAEQNSSLALEISHWGYVLEIGEVVYDDAASTLVSNDIVRKTYLGV